MSAARSPIQFPKQPPEPEIEIAWKDYARIDPGEYFGYCSWAGKYRDPQFKRWTCLLKWTILHPNLEQVLVKCLPQWFRLGDGEAPRVSTRSRYLLAWVQANSGRPPDRSDRRLSPKIFTGRLALVEVNDTGGPVPYSIVRRIVRWETGGRSDEAR